MDQVIGDVNPEECFFLFVIVVYTRRDKLGVWPAALVGFDVSAHHETQGIAPFLELKDKAPTYVPRGSGDQDFLAGLQRSCRQVAAVEVLGLKDRHDGMLQCSWR